MAENGPVCFGNEPPGLYLRGEDCLQLSQVVRNLHTQARAGTFEEAAIRRLLDLLHSVDPRRNARVRKLKEFEKCTVEKKRK